MAVPSVAEVLPSFCIELQALLLAAGRADLVDQIQHLKIVARCTCGEPNCAHFYTAAPPTGPYGTGHANLQLPADTGSVVLDLIYDRIVAVEVLDRPDVNVLLDAIMPVTNARRSPTLPCPACGFITVPDSSYGSYNICSICGWEDDAVQLANPACGGGANSESLVEAQAAALAEFPQTVQEHSGVARSTAWRPLNTLEIAAATIEREQGYWKNGAVTTPHECYWVRHRA